MTEFTAGRLMRIRKAVLIICIGFLSVSTLHAQHIIRVVKGYLLIDTDQGLGNSEDTIWISRIQGNRIVPIGRAKIIKFQAGKTAARMVSTISKRTPRINDIASIQQLTNTDVTVYTPEKPIQAKRDPRLQIPRTDRFGVHLGRLMPASHLEYRFENSLSLGGFVKLVRAGAHNVYLDLFYPVFKMRTPGAADADFSLLIVQLMDHVRMTGPIHYDFGAGLYQSHLNSSLSGQTVSVNKSYFGFFVGFSLDFPAASNVTISPSIRVHTYKADAEWSEFVFGGLNIYLSLF